MKELEKRMYFIVPYNISPIQQAIQAGHAALEYAHSYGNTDEYIDFIENWKTWIILNGGTTNNKTDSEGIALGSINQDYQNLLMYNAQRTDGGIRCASFREPDLNDALTAICLVVDERVFNREDYPDYTNWLFEEMKKPIPEQKIHEDSNETIEEYKKIVGDEIFFLKELLNTKRLA